MKILLSCALMLVTACGGDAPSASPAIEPSAGAAASPEDWRRLRDQGPLPDGAPDSMLRRRAETLQSDAPDPGPGKSEAIAREGTAFLTDFELYVFLIHLADPTATTGQIAELLLPPGSPEKSAVEEAFPAVKNIADLMRRNAIDLSGISETRISPSLRTLLEDPRLNRDWREALAKLRM